MTASTSPSPLLDTRSRFRRNALLLTLTVGLAASCVVVVSAAGATTAPTPAASYVATANALDTMQRTVQVGLGSANSGGAYASSPNAQFSVTPAAGHVAAIAPGHSVQASLPAVVSRDEQLESTFLLPTLPTAGNGVYYELELRRQANGDEYRVMLRVAPRGSMTMGFYRVRGQVQTAVGTQFALTQRAVAGHTTAVQGLVFGSAPVQLQSRAWQTGTATPNWQLSTTDASSGKVTTAGAVGLYAYVSASSSAAKVTVAGLKGWSLALPAPATSTSARTSSTPPVTPTSTPPTTTPATTSAPASSTSAPPSTTAPTTTAPETTPPVTMPAPSTTAPAPGSDQPGSMNTGVPAGTALTQLNGDLSLTTAGATYTGLDIHGFVTIKAADITIKNSIIRGGIATTGNPGIITDSLPSATNFVLQDSELAPEHPSVAIDGIRGANYTLLRVNIHGTVDGAKIIGDNVTITQSWIHDTASYPNDPYQGGGPTHNDAIQILGGHNITLTANTIAGGTNSGVQITQGSGSVANLAFTGNWADGGACTINVADKPLATMTTIDISHNIFGHTSTYKNCAIIYSTGVTMTHTDNTWAGTTNDVALSPRT